MHSRAPRMVPTLAALLLALPLVLAACGGAGTATPGATASVAAPPAVTPAQTVAPTAAATAALPIATPAPSAAADPRGAAPAKRGGGGTLRVLYWQAPTLLSAHLGSGAKDTHAARVVTEPLAVTSRSATYPDVPVLAKAIPSAADGSVAADGKSVTWKLKEGVAWSDGTPFTAADVKATWQYITEPKNGAADVGQYQSVAGIETPDATTVRITFKEATALWYTPFTNVNGAVLQGKQIAACSDPKGCDLVRAPVGTGPYVVKSFTPGDNVQFALNPAYREANAPYYDAIDWKGGGDAATAAKALIAGNVDFAWNLQVAPDILAQVTDAGRALDGGPGGGVEQILVNFTDPNTEVDGEKSSLKAPHPFLTDPKVREALSWLVDRESIAKNLYGAAGTAHCNVLPGIPAQVQSRAVSCGYDVAKANALLDTAGYARGADGIRAKGGARLQLTIRTTVGAVREKEEQVLKQAFQQAGIGMEIRNVDAGVFYGQPDNPDAFARFQGDLALASSTPTDPDPQDYLAAFTTNVIPQKANGWKGNNIGRWASPDYDRLFGQLKAERDPEKRAAIERQLNDLIVGAYARIPIVDRYAVHGRRADLSGTSYTPWDSLLWNVAYWQTKR